jgi:hypothetical protein
LVGSPGVNALGLYCFDRRKESPRLKAQKDKSLFLVAQEAPLYILRVMTALHRWALVDA